jgi:hypothetical protein
LNQYDCNVARLSLGQLEKRNCPFTQVQEFAMFTRPTNIAIAALLAASVGSAFAGNPPSAVLNINQADGKSWVEDVTGLLVVDAQNNFSVLQGSSATSFFQNGQLLSGVDIANHPDYWQWKTDATTNASYWGWHSAETISGGTPLSTDANDPWMSVLRLDDAKGHGTTDLSYAVSAVNNHSITQTYSFAFGEEIEPTVNTANTVHAQIAGALKTQDGNLTISPFGTNTAIQQLLLSADRGRSFFSAGVDVGPQASASGAAAYGSFAADAAGPTGQAWNYMQTLTKFTLTGKDSARLVGFASITPVPEPETFAMLLTGLGLIGLVARRRRPDAA